MTVSKNTRLSWSSLNPWVVARSGAVPGFTLISEPGVFSCKPFLVDRGSEFSRSGSWLQFCIRKLSEPNKISMSFSISDNNRYHTGISHFEKMCVFTQS